MHARGVGGVDARTRLRVEIGQEALQPRLNQPGVGLGANLGRGGRNIGEAFGEGGDLTVLLGEYQDRRWFFQVLGRSTGEAVQGRDRETLLFLAGECAGLLFIRELATPLPSSSSAP